jgi:hypothetical protein
MQKVLRLAATLKPKIRQTQLRAGDEFLKPGDVLKYSFPYL